MYHSECERTVAGFATVTSSSATEMRAALARLLAVQAGIAVIVAATFYLYAHAGAPALAALYGGGIGIASSALLGFRLWRAARPGASLGGLYIGAVERFVLVAAAFAVGIAVLGLAPVGMIAGFAGTQCGYFIAGRWVARRDFGSGNGS